MKRKFLVLPFLETMITQVCNLSCEGCTNYSDIKHSGYVPWKQGQQTLESWLERIDILDFGIMGGEPMINPEWREWIIGVRSLMPTSQIRFTTNGLLLGRVNEILDVMHEVGNIVFKITVHVDSPELERTISEVMALGNWRPVREYGIDRFHGENGVRFQINRPKKFLKTFLGPYHDMRPHHSDPRGAFSQCCQQTCPLLYGNSIYKCSTAGLLQDILDRHDRPNWDEWQPYLDQGIGPNDDDATINRFIENFGKVSSICGQCPSNQAPKLDHMTTVRFKSGR